MSTGLSKHIIGRMFIGGMYVGVALFVVLLAPFAMISWAWDFWRGRNQPTGNRWVYRPEDGGRRSKDCEANCHNEPDGGQKEADKNHIVGANKKGVGDE
jgi:hypothetical protein